MARQIAFLVLGESGAFALFIFFFFFLHREKERAFMSSFSLVPDKLSSRGEQRLGVTQHRGG